MLGALVSSVVAITLLVAGAGKLRDLEAHSRVVRGYKVLPDQLADRVGKVLPFAEILFGLCLLFGIGSPWVAWGVAGLFAMYGAGLTINLSKGRTELECGCFAFSGDERENAPKISWLHALRAGAFSLAAIAVIFLPVAPSVWTTVAAAGIAVVIVAMAFAVTAFAGVLNTDPTKVDTYLAPAKEQYQRLRAV